MRLTQVFCSSLLLTCALATSRMRSSYRPDRLLFNSDYPERIQCWLNKNDNKACPAWVHEPRPDSSCPWRVEVRETSSRYSMGGSDEPEWSVYLNKIGTWGSNVVLHHPRKEYMYPSPKSSQWKRPVLGDIGNMTNKEYQALRGVPSPYNINIHDQELIGQEVALREAFRTVGLPRMDKYGWILEGLPDPALYCPTCGGDGEICEKSSKHKSEPHGWWLHRCKMTPCPNDAWHNNGPQKYGGVRDPAPRKPARQNMFTISGLYRLLRHSPFFPSMLTDYFGL